ncbi:MAG TPA: SAV_6107 family HEPN domain-containing protein [Jiangellaceae bacterium]|nr:SAV_6107 family HEPN domain-containing protein [Jiangellaceae bacterium]
MVGHPVPRPRTGHAVVDLLEQSRSCLAEAASATSAGERYAAAHLAALRAGAAVLAARARAVPAGASGSRRGLGRGPRNVWTVLAAIAPELAEWAAFFAAGAGRRAAAEAGLPGAVTARESDDLLRDADAFLGLVCAVLGLPHQQPLAGTAVGLAG